MKVSIVCTAIDIDVDYYQEFLESKITESQDALKKAPDLIWPLSTIVDALEKHIIESDRDLLLELLVKLYPDGDINGNISLDAAYASFNNQTETNIRDQYADADIQIFSFDDDGNNECVSSINIADMLLKLLEDENSYGEFDATVGAYVESCLMSFESSSRWHYGYICRTGSNVEKVPLLWYGPDNAPPIDKWSIKYGEKISEHWFESDSWELLNHLVDGCSDCFSIWYTAECCYWLPDMEEILSKCPIQLSMSDNLEDINRKFKEFFSDKTERTIRTGVQ